MFKNKLQFQGTYPEVNLKVPATTKLPVADLESNGHLIILMQCLMEAFSRVCLELDVVTGHGCDPPKGGDQKDCCRESHFVYAFSGMQKTKLQYGSGEEVERK